MSELLSWAKSATDVLQKGKDVMMNTPEIEIKVRDATDNDVKWGPTMTQMRELSAASYRHSEFPMMMAFLWKRLHSPREQHRTVYKTLLVLEHLLKNGSEGVLREFRIHEMDLQRLKRFHFIDGSVDVGANIKKRAKMVLNLVHDQKRLREEREKARKNQGKYTGMGSDDRLGYRRDGGYKDRNYDDRSYDDRNYDDRNYDNRRNNDHEQYSPSNAIDVSSDDDDDDEFEQIASKRKAPKLEIKFMPREEPKQAAPPSLLSFPDAPKKSTQSATLFEPTANTNPATTGNDFNPRAGNRSAPTQIGIVFPPSTSAQSTGTPSLFPPTKTSTGTSLFPPAKTATITTTTPSLLDMPSSSGTTLLGTTAQTAGASTPSTLHPTSNNGGIQFEQFVKYETSGSDQAAKPNMWSDHKSLVDLGGLTVSPNKKGPQDQVNAQKNH
eukprot:TRINITY_DN1962_c0_g1_i1.p1 TRINITY_DN1962_c0_g1~~TRINITY_DN1962_c0_g1_i1.p1  ORF type:complete len:439 (-),score=85.65 TRINITY_DN1962_c0_g1_i1:71-1387(-)